MNALIVQRNNGLDGFLKTHFQGTPVAIRVQRQNETLEEAKKQLLKASITKGCILKILIRTTPYHATSMFDLEDTGSNLLVIDNHDLSITQWLQEKREQATMLA
jgi:site-specific DNA-methyltransferase (adenine-specific)